MRKNKIGKKYLLSSVVILSALSLVAVGFSSWTMNGSLPDSANVKVNVGSVLDQTLIVEINESSDLSFSFDNLESSSITNGDFKTEDLEFKIVYRLESTRVINTSDFSLNFRFSNNVKTSYSALNTADAQYMDTRCVSEDFSITLPVSSGTISTIENCISTVVSYDSDNMGANVETKFNFHWGSAFKNSNPGNYYNPDTDTNDVYFELAEKLKSFDEICKNLPVIDLTIEPSFVGEAN